MNSVMESSIEAVLEVRERLQKELAFTCEDADEKEEAILAQYVQAVFLSVIADAVGDLEK